MMKEKNLYTYAISKAFPRMFISWLVFILLILITIAPVIAYTVEAGLDQKSSTLTQPTESKTVSPHEVTSPEITSDDGGDSPPVSNEIIPKVGIETPVIDTEVIPEVHTIVKEVSADITTQTLTTPEELLISNSGNNVSTSSTSLTPGNADDPIQTIQQVTLSVTPSANTSDKTGVNSIDVTTSQPYVDVSAQISINDQKPPNVPSIRLQNENQFIESYITIHLLGDSVALSDDEIQSMTMTFKIKKNPNDQTANTENQIYVLTYETNPVFSLSHPFISESISPYNSGVWQPIIPIEITEDEEFIYYHVETPSYFATFAIVGTDFVEIQPYQSGMPEIPWDAIIVTITLATTLLIIVLFKTGFIYQVEEHADGKTNKKFLKETNQKWSYKIKLTTTPPELQTLRSPTLYFAAAPRSPQIITASTHLQETPEECEEDPMYL